MASSGNQFKLWAARAANSQPSLLALTLQTSTASAGVGGSTNILGRTAGSTLTLTDSVGGVFSVDSTTAVLSWTSGLASGANTPTIRETLAGSPNSPRDSSPTLTGTSGLVITDATGGSGKFSSYIPVFRDAYVAMTPLVSAGDEAIDIQAVCGAPYSPLATRITFTGSDLTYFDKAAGGKLVFKAATRASVPKDTTYTLSGTASNAAGSSEPFSLKIFVPADADCRFISFDKGVDSLVGNAGQTPSNPWKHCPDTQDWSTTNVVFTGATAGKCFFFEGVDRGAKHATSLCQTGFSTFFGATHNGTISKAHRYCFTGWGGQAKFTGANDLTGSWSSVASGDIFSSGATGVEKISLSTFAEWFQIVSFGETQGFMSQYPRPNVLTQSNGAQAAYEGTNNYNDTLGTSDGGMKRVRYSTNAGDTFTPRFYKPASGMCYIEDAKLAPRFNNTNWSLNTSGVGIWLLLWRSGNNLDIVPVQQFDASTNRLYIANALPNSPDGTWTAYALLGSPYDVQLAGQYAFSADGLTVIAKRPNANQAVIARRSVGASCGRQDYVTFHQAWFERYVNGKNRAGDDTEAVGGCAMYAYNAAGAAAVRVYGLRSHQCFSGYEGATLFGTHGSNAGFTDFMFDRFHLTECRMGAASVANIAMWGPQTGSTAQGGPTVAEIIAYSSSKCRWWFFEDDCCTRSLIYWIKLRGVEFIEPVIGRFVTTHGDGLPWYQDGTGTYADHNLVRDALGMTVERWRTTSASSQPDRTVPFNNTFLRCVVLGYYAGNYGVDLYDGDPGALYQQCVFMADATDSTNTLCFKGGSGYANMTLLNCVANGVLMGTAAGGNGEPATWTLDSCYFTADSKLNSTSFSILADDAANNRRVLSCTRGTNKANWDYVTVPTDWLTTLRKGASSGTTKLGPFLYV